MGHGSTARLRLELAPGGLSFVQELVNTALGRPKAGIPDLLESLDDARRWLADALAIWSRQTGRPAPALELGERDLPGLRAVREAVRSGEPGALPAQSVELELTAEGVVYHPSSVAGLVYAERLLAEADGTWPRLKCCVNPDCAAAFYDRSRNCSRVWHDTKTCGNVMNLRASRARRSRAS